jgi:hypothetical protein
MFSSLCFSGCLRSHQPASLSTAPTSRSFAHRPHPYRCVSVGTSPRAFASYPLIRNHAKCRGNSCPQKATCRVVPKDLVFSYCLASSFSLACTALNLGNIGSTRHTHTELHAGDLNFEGETKGRGMKNKKKRRTTHFACFVEM